MTEEFAVVEKIHNPSSNLKSNSLAPGRQRPSSFWFCHLMVSSKMLRNLQEENEFLEFLFLMPTVKLNRRKKSCSLSIKRKITRKLLSLSLSWGEETHAWRIEVKCLDVYQKFLKQHDKLAAKQQSKFNNTNICRHNFLIFFIIYGNLKPFIFLYRDIIWNMAKKKKSLTPIIHPLILMHAMNIFVFMGCNGTAEKLIFSLCCFKLRNLKP